MAEIRRRVKAVIGYDGTRYFGFERQQGVPTIQGELEKALARVTQENIRVVGAGRTDAGVHAAGQVIHFDTSWGREISALKRAVNALLPQDIVVKELDETSPEFHARKSALRRRYRYTIYDAPLRDPMQRLYAYHSPRAVNNKKMDEALKMVIGEHDFAAFGSSPSGKGTVREVYEAVCWREGQLIYIEVEANSFLRHMMRRLVAALLKVGEGILSPSDFGEILEKRDPGLVKGSASAQGLCLTQVRYPA